MKGIVYSGIVYAPEHPDADLHGLVRAAIRERSWILARRSLEREFGESQRFRWLLNSEAWTNSKSNAESLATEKHYGEILVCPIVRQYLDPKYYKPIKKRKSEPQADAVHTGRPPKEF